MGLTSREESWATDAKTTRILRQVSAVGYIVSVHRLQSSLLGTIAESVEMHAIHEKTGEQFIVRAVEPHSPAADYRCARVMVTRIARQLVNPGLGRNGRQQ